MVTKKLTAIWHIITKGKTLEGKMKLLILMQNFYMDVAQDLEQTAIEAGELHTLNALRALTIEKIEDGRN
jgi:hypothetical protein